MAHLTSAATGLAFELTLHDWEASLSKGLPAERWLRAGICFLYDGDLPTGIGRRFMCYLLRTDVGALCQSLRGLLDGTLSEVGYSPLEPAFRLVIGPSAVSGFIVPEPWSATITMDASFLHNGEATGSGPALTLILDAPAIASFVEELEGEFQSLANL